MASKLPPEVEHAARHLLSLLRAEASKFLSADKLPDIRLETAAISLVVDPSNGQPGYEGTWRNHLNERVGRLICNSDGSFYAEYDLCVRHPAKPQWFVEAVTAWGRGETVKAEARLIPMV